MGEVGDRLEESKTINLSLSALAKVMATLCEAKGRPTHVPYRDSKLTRLLQDSLGGNCRTAMVACVSPLASALDDTPSTLQFTSRAKAIRNNARVNLQARKSATAHHVQTYQNHIAITSQSHRNHIANKPQSYRNHIAIISQSYRNHIAIIPLARLDQLDCRLIAD